MTRRSQRLPPLKQADRATFRRPQGIFTDFKRHDLGPNFYERNFDGTFQREFMTEPLWGVGNDAPYGHDGRSMNLREVILRHGGEAQESGDALRARCRTKTAQLLEFLQSLVLFPPGRYGVEPGPGRSRQCGLSAVRPWQYRAR